MGKLMTIVSGKPATELGRVSAQVAPDTMVKSMPILIHRGF